MNHISKFLGQNPDCVVKAGECGFGRPCVGIMEMPQECWVSYVLYEGKDYETVGECHVASMSAPKDAYHKHPCLAVLVHNDDYDEATKQLNKWIGDIMNGGYATKKYLDYSGIAALTGGQYLVGIVDNEN